MTPNENAACDECGAFGAFVFDGHTLCPDCYANRGSCCAEFPDMESKRCEGVSHPPREAPHRVGPDS